MTNIEQTQFLILRRKIYHHFHDSKADSGYTIIKLLFTFLKDAHRGRRKALLTEKLFTQRALVLALEVKACDEKYGLAKLHWYAIQSISEKNGAGIDYTQYFFWQYKYENLEYISGTCISSFYLCSKVSFPNHQFPLGCISTLSDINYIEVWMIYIWLVLVYVYAMLSIFKCLSAQYF